MLLLHHNKYSRPNLISTTYSVVAVSSLSKSENLATANASLLLLLPTGMYRLRLPVGHLTIYCATDLQYDGFWLQILYLHRLKTLPKLV